MTLYSSGLITCRVEREETVRTCVGCCIEWYEQQVGLVLKTPMEDLVKMLDWNWFRQRAVARGDVEGGDQIVLTSQAPIGRRFNPMLGLLSLFFFFLDLICIAHIT